MKKINNIEEYIETKCEDGYVIHLTWDEMIALETAVAIDMEERQEAYDAEWEFSCSPWDKARIDLLGQLYDKLTEARTQ